MIISITPTAGSIKKSFISAGETMAFETENIVSKTETDCHLPVINNQEAVKNRRGSILASWSMELDDGFPRLERLT